MRLTEDTQFADWPPDRPPIVVESLESDGGLGGGARVRVTDGDQTWEGTVGAASETETRIDRDRDVWT